VFHDFKIKRAYLFAQRAFNACFGIYKQGVFSASDVTLDRAYGTKRTPGTGMNQYPKYHTDGSCDNAHEPEHPAPMRRTQRIPEDAIGHKSQEENEDAYAERGEAEARGDGFFQADVNQYPVKKPPARAQIPAHISPVKKTPHNARDHDQGNEKSEQRIFPSQADREEHDPEKRPLHDPPSFYNGRFTFCHLSPFLNENYKNHS
jgi:hypothetical protein